MKFIIFVFAFVLFLAANAYPNAETEDLDSPLTSDESIETRKHKEVKQKLMKHKEVKHKDVKRKNVKNKGGCQTTTVAPPTCPCLIQGDGCSFDNVLKFFEHFKLS
jgi:hypothetical protein